MVTINRTFNPDPFNVTKGRFTSSGIPSADSLFSDLSNLSATELQKFQIEQQTYLSTSNLIQQFESQQREARQAREAYDSVLRERNISASNARKLAEEQNAVQLRLANYRKDIADINASQTINNAFSVARAGMADLQTGLRQSVQNRSFATAAFAKGGVDVGRGSAKAVVNNVLREGLRQVDNNFADSLNRVNNYLAQAFTLKFNAEMDLLATEEQNRLNTRLTELNLGNESGVAPGESSEPKELRIKTKFRRS